MKHIVMFNFNFICVHFVKKSSWKCCKAVKCFLLYIFAIYFIIVDIVGVAIYSIAIYFIIADIAGVAIYSLVARTIASLGCTDQRPGGDCIINKDAPNYFYTLYISHYKCLNLIQKAATL